MTSNQNTNSGPPATVKKYDVVVKYTVEAASRYEVFAESEDSAKNIALYRLFQDRRDYADLRNITAEIRKPK